MKFSSRSDVDIYRIRNHMYQIRKTRYGLDVDVDIMLRYMGSPRWNAHYDPIGGYMGREWTFVDENDEVYMVCQSYKNFYVASRKGGYQLIQFRGWVVGQLGPPTVEY